MSWLLDTNTCIYLLTGNQPEHQRRILARLEGLAHNERPWISTVVMSELRYGVQKSRWRKANAALLDEFLLDFDIADYGVGAGNRYGEIRADLEKRGRPIGPMDLMICAHAISLEAVLVTHSTREFSRVKGLQLDDWTK